jgi:hypothetical protein
VRDRNDGKGNVFVSTEKRNYFFLSIMNKRRLGMGPNTVLFMDSDCDPLANVNVLSSTHGLDHELCRAGF